MEAPFQIHTKKVRYFEITGNEIIVFKIVDGDLFGFPGLCFTAFCLVTEVHLILLYAIHWQRLPPPKKIIFNHQKPSERQ